VTFIVTINLKKIRKKAKRKGEKYEKIEKQKIKKNFFCKEEKISC